MIREIKISIDEICVCDVCLAQDACGYQRTASGVLTFYGLSQGLLFTAGCARLSVLLTPQESPNPPSISASQCWEDTVCYHVQLSVGSEDPPGLIPGQEALSSPTKPTPQPPFSSCYFPFAVS